MRAGEPVVVPTVAGEANVLEAEAEEEELEREEHERDGHRRDDDGLAGAR